MITRVKEPYKISRREVDQKFDGRWVLLDYRDLNWAKGYGYIVAYGSDDEQEQDKDSTELIWVSSNEYGGKAHPIHGYKNRGAEMLHVL
jgi:hypothetical protein